MISEKNKFIYIKVPKTATSSIEYTLTQAFKDDELTWDEQFEKYPWIRKHSKLDWFYEHLIDLSEYFCFSFIRNPWDLVLSFWTYYQNEKIIPWKPVNWAVLEDMGYERWKEGDDHYIEKEKSTKGVDFNEWIKTNYDWMQGDQVSFFDNADREMDFIGRYENLNADYDTLCKKLKIENKLGHVNKKSTKSNRQDTYNEESKKIVEDYFMRDIEKWGFEF